MSNTVIIVLILCYNAFLPVVRDCRLKYIFKLERLLATFLGFTAVCNQIETFFIVIHSVDSEGHKRQALMTCALLMPLKILIDPYGS